MWGEIFMSVSLLYKNGVILLVHRKRAPEAGSLYQYAIFFFNLFFNQSSAHSIPHLNSLSLVEGKD